jgi:hypothetical protein
MTVGAAAYLDIQWIDMAFNTSGSAAGYSSKKSAKSLVPNEHHKKRCKTVCRVDNVQKLGYPEVIAGSSSAISVTRLYRPLDLYMMVTVLLVWFFS